MMSSIPLAPLTTWATEALREYEERLYDQEVAGEDVWYLRDEVLWELTRRAAESRHLVGGSTK